MTGRPESSSEGTLESDQWFNDLWRLHAGSVYGYAARRVGAEQAADVVEDTFVVVWRQRRQRQFVDLPWLLGIARNVLRERRRQSERADRLGRRVASQLRPEGSESDPARLAVAAEGARVALAALREGDREVLMLCAWEGLSTRDAAIVMGVSHSAFRVRHLRARRRLGALVDEQSGSPREEDS